MHTCKFCQKISKTLMHETRCPRNPNRFVSKGNLGKVAWNKGKTKETDTTVARLAQQTKMRPARIWTSEQLAKLSASMVKAHQEGRAWNIGKNRWKKLPSYPERFFIEVIQNHFDDTNFKREVWFQGFVLDFLWEHKRLVIEIDGKQHDMPQQRERDVKKDALLRSEGYQVLRIRWSNMCNNPTEWIQKANTFIGAMA